MTEICKTCGSELFAGQRFCRACGNSTETLDSGEAPTQQFGDDPLSSRGEATTRQMQPPDDWGARSVGNTAPQARPNTNPVGKPPAGYQAPSAYQAPPTSYQLPPPPPAWRPPQYAPPTTTTSRGSSGWAIFLAIFLALMLGAMVVGRAVFRRVRDRMPVAGPQIPGPATAEDLKTFTLAKGAAVAIQTINGSITVTGWDGPQAEVHILASNGANPSDVSIRSDNNSLAISAPAKGKISFEVRLPRELGNVVFNSTNGGVTVSDVSGQLTVETVNGSIRLNQVSGIDRAKSVNGGIEATLRQAVKDRPMTFESMNGGIDLRFPGDFNGTLDASAMHGGIKVDDSFPEVKSEKTFPVGMRAGGPIGTGGSTVTARTTNGGIKIGR
ncbi:MAG TPA: DUF4097 family beta strand repeat-containing protein [Blastocatellia bacterium]|nr:DUF4097 family beta strand repeat-containing protein [Blastocatellia bacterium]